MLIILTHYSITKKIKVKVKYYKKYNYKLFCDKPNKMLPIFGAKLFFLPLATFVQPDREDFSLFRRAARDWAGGKVFSLPARRAPSAMLTVFFWVPVHEKAPDTSGA